MKIAIIGAGSSGLTSIKCCLDEGLEPTCFERSNDIGGVWRFTHEVEDGRASIYESVVSNTSKELMCYSDFPYPENFPNYLHNSKMLEYYRMYVDHFGLLKYIQFKTVVLSVQKCSDFASTGRWSVTTEKEGTQENVIFDAVMVCSGHHSEPHFPLDSYPGIKQFKGQYFHSQEYKNPTEYKGKRVVIIGMGNSASDIAVELSRTAAQVFLSTKRGAWVIRRVSDNGYPSDILHNRRFYIWMRNTLPSDLVMWITEKKFNQWFDHANYGLQPTDRTQFKEPLFNDDLPSRITCGSVLVKTSVRKITETAVQFEDGTVEENIDVIIFATGYNYSFPFLDASVIKIDSSRTYLYKNIIPPNLEKATLGILGLIQPLGPIMPTAELQARWITRIFKGLCRFPPKNEVMDDIEKDRKIFIKRYGTTRENRLQVEFIEYLDSLASDIGVKPNIWYLFLTDPLLAMALCFGPCTPAQFRLTGPGKWPQARKQVMTTWDRIIKSTKTRTVKSKGPRFVTATRLLAALCLVVLLLSIFVYQSK
ncbi:hypothetical protein XENTR_v10012235 [Xenopus tropicalis]|uniref:Flavin-containing monooxygenase n=1 Tax=Xenopus tropicalis TaxID=8364 RepID=F6TKZ0_XENTR|nr:hypothetical protein XENTR_v10012235 [Xenopus tropicalis]